MSLIKKKGNNLKKLMNNFIGNKNDQEMMKVVMKDHMDFTHSMKYNHDTQYNENELFLFNHKGWLLGYLDNDFTSADHILMRSAMRQPKGILLGDCNINDLMKFQVGMDKYHTTPNIEKISGENLMGRQLFMDYFRSNFNTNLYYYKEYGDYKISEIDSIYKRKVFNANLTLAYLACYYDSMKIIFSSPNKLIHIEDLVINFSLEELQFAFYQTVQEYSKRAKIHEFNPPLNPPEFSNILQRITQEIHTEKLFDKKCQYSAAIFRKIHKLYPDNILFMPHHLVPKTYEHITDSFCPEFDEIYRNKEFKQKLRETPTDLKQLEIVLEKICILSHIIDKEFTYYIQNFINPLHVMFAGKFSHFPDDQVFQIYNKINAMYQSELENIFFNDLKRIENTIALGRTWTRDYTEEVTKWDKTSEISKILPKTEFIIDKHRKEEEMEFINQLLLSQIGINIREKELQGKNMNLVKLQLRKYFSGMKTKQNESLYNELLVEANAQLGLLKLPNTFKKFENKLNEVLYESLEKILGEDPQKVYKEAVNKIYNQLVGIDPFIVKDGSEMEMKENMLNKNQDKLIEISEKFIFNKKEKKETFNKSIQVRTSFVKKLDDEIKIMKSKLQSENENENDDNFIDISNDLEKTENENEKKKLEIIHELKNAFDNEELDENNQMIQKNELINFDIFKDKSLDELKKMDIEEVAEYDLEADEEGQLKLDTVFKNDNELERIEKEMTSGRSGKLTNLDLSELPAEKNYMSVYKTLSRELRKKDMERSEKIEIALENGIYLDDPIYIQILMTEPKFIKLREKFLKKYFRGENNNKNDKIISDKLKNFKMPILDKYAKMEGGILENMQKDDVFYKYDSVEGKQVTKLFDKFMNDLDEEVENEEEMNLSEKLGTDFTMANDHEEEHLGNVFEYMKDRIEEMRKSNPKSIYMNSNFNPNSNKEIGNENSENNQDYQKGRNMKKNNLSNKKLKLL